MAPNMERRSRLEVGCDKVYSGVRMRRYRPSKDGLLHWVRFASCHPDYPILQLGKETIVVTLDVYVVKGCGNCRYARILANNAAQAFPEVRVRVLELDEEENPPAEVFAAPTYLLNGRVVSLGNPSQSELYALLEKASWAIS